MKVLVFDFEVFRKNVLLGAIDLNANKTHQLWGSEAIKAFYGTHRDYIWVGHNNAHYDNHILQAVLSGDDPFAVSKSIIEGGARPKLTMRLDYYDTMSRHFTSLKVLEAYMGKNISETPIDFRLDRELTPEERKMVESYNRDDLDQTLQNLKFVKKEFQLRLDLIKEFDLPLSVLHMTEAQIAATVLKAKKVRDIEDMPMEPIEWPNLRVSNKAVMDFYRSKSWAWTNGSARPSIKQWFCGTEHTIAAGGIHAGGLRHEPFAYYLDVSGYYNLVMINYGLLSRAIPEEGKALYEYMYREQLKLKKKDPVKRAVYKTILLAVFGAQNNQYCDFYDPYCGDLVRLTGELFLVDLLEKLEGHVDVIQSNTDGIMVKPLEGETEESVKAIVDEWQKRTKFTLKFEKIYDVVQRDVNNYIYKDENGAVHVKGEAVKHWECPESPMECDSYNSKEPLIIAKCVVEWYVNGEKPEKVVYSNAKNLRLFQFICKKGAYDSLEIDDGTICKTLQNVNRVFAGKRSLGILYKRKDGSRVRYASVPGGVFVHNGAIDAKLEEKIDYDYYVRRAYERIAEFERKPEQGRLF